MSTNTRKANWLIESCTVLYNSQITNDCYQLVVKASEISDLSNPGQFINILLGQSQATPITDPLLPRPFSIYNVDKKHGYLSIVYRVVGKGTNILSQINPSEQLKITGPLGSGFSTEEIEGMSSSSLLVAGGIGIFPLYFLARSLKEQGKRYQLLLGLKDDTELPLVSPFEDLGVQTDVSTEDGSYGFHGRVTNLLDNKLQQDSYDHIFTCGPEAMMQTVTDLALPEDIPVQVSLERTMACGVGACLGCSCKASNNIYKQVCTDGPVFWGNEVIFNAS